jgi:hypothetical protein
MKIAIVDYGLANVRSVVNAVQYFGAEAIVAKRGDQLADADKIILPGVGHFDAGMAGLQRAGHAEALERLVREQGRPFLGILERYLQMTRPETVELAMRGYDYFHFGQHPVLADYADIAKTVGLQLVAERRAAPIRDDRIPRAAIGPHAIDRAIDGGLEDVLADIHNFNPNVRRNDLLTSSVLLAFVKPEESPTSVATRTKTMLDQRNKARAAKLAK